ncbi:thiamine-phosphate kinase [Xanthomonadaceae bacterium JHOS43]|nr:thiamine-phosphate kinase [Xanthomonadaceae bacterium JHOS43]
MAEFDLIARILARAGVRADVALGIGDDGALLVPPAGQQLVAVCDTLNAGVHFLPDADPADIGWKSLAVNLSDLAAMGATPSWALLSLSLPQADADFVERFMQGFSALADESQIALVGGDTTHGSLSVGVTALGFVPAGMAMTRGGARPGDAVYVSGTLGDAAAALRLQQSVDGAAGVSPALLARLNRPTPRVTLGQALRGVANAAIDISDGLLADLAHVARASGVGIELQAGALPISKALSALASATQRVRWQATGGDDYELAFTLPPERVPALEGLGVTCIGRVVAGEGVRLRDGTGESVVFEQAGWEHFTGATQ